MDLTIKSNKNTYNKAFAKYLTKKAYTYILSNINSKELKRIDKYLNDNLSLFTKKLKYIKSFDIIIEACKHQIVLGKNGDYIISIDPNYTIDGYNMKLIDLCQMINFGNLSLKGYPIFSRAYKYVGQRIRHYWSMWFLLGGVV